MEDLLGRGGPGHAYRLQAIRDSPGFGVDLLDALVNVPSNSAAAVGFRLRRRGYDGPVRISIPDLPEDLVLSGGNVPSEPPGTERSDLPNYFTLSAKPGAKPRVLFLSVWGESSSGGRSLREQAGAAGMTVRVAGLKQRPFTAPWLGPELPASIARSAPLSLEVSTTHVRLTQGSEFRLGWKLVRSSSATSPIKVDRRPIGNIRQINFVKAPEEAQSPDQGAVFIKTTLATPTTTFDLLLDGTITRDDKPERVVTAPAVSVEIVPLYGINLTSQKLNLAPGGKLELAGRVEREPGFTAPVRIKLEGLPAQLSSAEITVPEGESQFRIPIEASAEARSQKLESRLASTALLPEMKTGSPYSIPEVRVALTVSTGEAAQ